jgi:hypothetical protein
VNLSMAWPPSYSWLVFLAYGSQQLMESPSAYFTQL